MTGSGEDIPDKVIEMKKHDVLCSCFIFFILLLNSSCLLSQDKNGKIDSVNYRDLDSVWVKAYVNRSLTALPDVEGWSIYSGKKSNRFYLNPASTNLAANVSRNAFAKIPGINLWDMDGGGTQFNIGTRGSNAHRSIEMNIRQNGYNTNSDMFGYPETHYTPPLQGIRSVELVRGSAALQFGSQFGGMLNFVMKEADSAKSFSLESEQSAGSNGFFNSFTSLGGNKGKLSYYTYYDYRHTDGWRKQGKLNYHAWYFHTRYSFSSKTSISFQFSRMDYIQQTAGGLTDAQFSADPRQSTRSRNYFNPAINIPALIFETVLGPSTRIRVSTHAVLGQRNSAMFIAPATIADTINPSTSNYSPRQIDRDYYKGFTTEARLLQPYRLGNMESVLAAGLRFQVQETKRRQKGVGTTASDFDLSLTAPYGIDLKFHTGNQAFFAENIFRITSRFSITPGFRYELIRTRFDGLIDDQSVEVDYRGNRRFPLFGVGAQYQSGAATQLYANWSQAYRPYLYAYVTPAERIDKIDPDLKDSRGFDIDLGYRGHIRDKLNFDISAFYLYYGDHVGLVSRQDNTGPSYLFTTNAGNSVAKGVELFADISLLRWFPFSDPDLDLRVFNSFSFTHARYLDGMIKSGSGNILLKGHQIEGTPEVINRTGLSLWYKRFESSLQLHHTGKMYSDANNTVYSTDGSVGIVPAYTVWDFSCRVQAGEAYYLSASINNITNRNYFTRRITTYPGPGILPADGRTFVISFGIKL